MPPLAGQPLVVRVDSSELRILKIRAMSDKIHTSPLLPTLPTLTLFGYCNAHSCGLVSSPSISPPSAWHFTFQKHSCHFRPRKFVWLCSARLSWYSLQERLEFSLPPFGSTLPPAWEGCEGYCPSGFQWKRGALPSLQSCKSHCAARLA